MNPAVFGPLATTWFGFLQRRVRIPGSPNAEILARVGLDQTVLAPLNLFAFLSSMVLGPSEEDRVDLLECSLQELDALAIRPGRELQVRSSSAQSSRRQLCLTGYVFFLHDNSHFVLIDYRLELLPLLP